MKEKRIEDELDYYYIQASDENEVDPDDMDSSFELESQDENGKTTNPRHEFRENTRRELMIRAGLRCSNPYCRKMTVAYDETIQKVVSIGEAAHIIAAKAGGPRNEKGSSYTSKEISSIDNGIWLCANCHSMIDKKGNEVQYSANLLRDWKKEAETRYIDQISKPRLDFINSLKDNLLDTKFCFQEASALQIAIITYCAYEYKNISFGRATPWLDQNEEDDGFFDQYRKLHSWLTSTGKIKLKLILDLGMPTPESLVKDLYIYWKSKFVDALLSNNMTSFVISDKKTITIDCEKVFKIIFDGDYNKAQEYFDKIIEQ